MNKKTILPFSHVVFFLVVCVPLLGGCAFLDKDKSTILYSNQDFAVQQVSPDEIIIHNGSQSVTEKVEANSKKKSRVQVSAPSENDNNLIIVLHGEDNNKYQAHAWPKSSQSPCVIRSSIDNTNCKPVIEWATPLSYSIIDRKTKEVREVAAYDDELSAWTQFFPHRKVLKVCPTRNSSGNALIEGEYEAGKMQVIISLDGKAISLFYNNKFYRIDLAVPLTMPHGDKVTVSPDGKIAILALVDGEKEKQLRLFAWSARKAEPTTKVLNLSSDNEIDVTWLSNSSVAFSEKSGQVNVIRYNLDRSWQEISPVQLP